MHPTQKFVRRHQHGLTSAKVRTPADSVSHHSQDIPEQQLDRKTRDAPEASCSNRTAFLNLSRCSSPAASDPLLPTWMSLILSSSCWFSLISPPDASACRTATCSSSLFLGSTGTSPAPRTTRALLHSLTRSVSAILSLYAFILAFHRQGSHNDRSDSLSAFIVMWLCRFFQAMQALRILGSLSSVSVSFNVPQTKT